MNTRMDLGIIRGYGETTERPADEVIQWTVDPERGLVQGPLDLEFLRDRCISLTLQPAQIALLVEGSDLQAVFLDGTHNLVVGDGRGDVSSRGHLVFLTLGQGLNVKWTRDEPLRLADQSAGVIGDVTVAVEGPRRFYHTFLAGGDNWDEDFIRRLMRQAARSALESLLEGSGPDPVQLQTRLANLEAESLDEELAPMGLACRHVALYTSAPPVEAVARDVTGQFVGVRHN